MYDFNMNKSIMYDFILYRFLSMTWIYILRWWINSYPTLGS